MPYTAHILLHSAHCDIYVKLIILIGSVRDQVIYRQGWAIRKKIIELHVKQYKKNNCIVQFNMQLIVNCNCMRLDKAISDAIWYILERFLSNPTFCVIPLPQSAGNP